MIAVQTTWRAWATLMDRRESPAALACMRIAASLVLLADLLSVRRVGLISPIRFRTVSAGGAP